MTGAAAFVSELVEMPPPERYRDIMVEGYKHFGVVQKAVAWLEGLEVVPREPASAWIPIEMSEGMPTFSRNDIETCDGDNGRPLRWICNGKVLEWVGPLDHHLCNMFKETRGTDQVFTLAKFKYDPKYGAPTSVEDMSEEYKACVESHIANSMKSMPEVRAVGWLG